MKILHLSMILMACSVFVTFSIQNVQAMPYMSPQDLYKQSDMVFHGQVISKQTGPGPDYYYYQIKVDTYFKNPQTSDSITVAGHKSDNKTGLVSYPQFKVEDKAIFYINKIGGINTISPYSQIAGDVCDVRSFTESDTLPSPPTLGAAVSTTIYIEDVNENMPYIPLINHTAILRDDNVWNNSPESITVPVTLTIQNQDTGQQVFNQTQNLEMQACSGPETVKWNFIPIQIANYVASVSGNKNEISMIFQTISDSDKSSILSPLKQFKSGISANDVKCEQGLQLVIKAKDGSPTCVRPQTAQKLVERGWGWAMQPIDSLKPLLPNRITGFENDTGTVTFGNRTYYFETPHYIQNAWIGHPIQISFHDVVFALFPSGFKGGLPDNICGSQYYWTDAEFSDGTRELLHIFPITSTNQQCLALPEPIYFSTHTNPQTGLTFYDGKMKLLVSTSVTNSTSNGPEFKVSSDLLGPIPHQLVFFMKSNSTAKIFVEYASNESNTGTMPSYSSVYVGGAENYTRLTTSDVTINADPSSIPLTEGSNTTVVYNITAKEGIREFIGYFWHSFVE